MAAIGTTTTISAGPPLERIQLQPTSGGRGPTPPFPAPAKGRASKTSIVRCIGHR